MNIEDMRLESAVLDRCEGQKENLLEGDTSAGSCVSVNEIGRGLLIFEGRLCEGALASLGEGVREDLELAVLVLTGLLDTSACL